MYMVSLIRETVYCLGYNSLVCLCDMPSESLDMPADVIAQPQRIEINSLTYLILLCVPVSTVFNITKFRHAQC